MAAGGIAQDHAGAEETDAGQHALDDAAQRIDPMRRILARRKNEQHRERAAEADQRIRAHAGLLAVQIAVEPDGGADDERSGEPHHDVEPCVGHRIYLAIDGGVAILALGFARRRKWGVVSGLPSP